MKSADGRDAENVVFGSTLSNDRHAGAGFDYMIANPPYGKDWKRDQDAVRDEHDRGAAGRFGPGLPRISDGQLLFLLHMLAHVRSRAEGGSRVAIIMNGSPLFIGDAGSGGSEIRRWILEHDRFSPPCASATPSRNLPRPGRSSRARPGAARHENVPMREDVESFFEREVKPLVPDAWGSTAVNVNARGLPLRPSALTSAPPESCSSCAIGPSSPARSPCARAVPRWPRSCS